MRFFAGIPLLGPGGLVLGSLCLVGREPQQPTDAQCSAFTELAGVWMLGNCRALLKGNRQSCYCYVTVKEMHST